MTVSLTNAAVVAIGGSTSDHSTSPTSPERSLREVAGDLLIASREPGIELAVLVGGEPMSRRDLPQLLQLVSKLGLLPGLVTNGRALASESVRKLLIGLGVAYLRVGLHGACAATHDAAVGEVGAFDQTMEGLRALLVGGPRSLLVDVAVTVTSSNLTELVDIVGPVGSLPRTTSLGLRFLAPLQSVAQQTDTVEAAEAVAKAVALATTLGSDIITTWEGFPPCVLPDEVAHLRDETLRYGVISLGPGDAASALPREERGSRRHPLPCQECIHRPSCPGVPLSILELEGEEILRPTRRVIANSFNFEINEALEGFHLEAGRCSAQKLDLSDGLLRSMILESEGALYLCTTPTSDFTNEQINIVKNELEQLYLDRSSDAALDDFTTSVRRLHQHVECANCRDSSRCCQAFSADDEEPFAREERWLRKEVSRLRGRVLDVGCGELLYREELDRLIADGSIEYVGIDPDEESLERLRESGFRGTLLPGEIEDFEAKEGTFDYVLALRSFNHFRDVEQAFTVITRVLRVQGQLVICDSPPFGMVRTPDQVVYADRHARHGHEHYRNWTSHQVVAMLRRFPYSLNVHRPVTRETSAQWILKLLRAPARRS